MLIEELEKTILMYPYQDMTEFELYDAIEEMKSLAFACDLLTETVITQKIKSIRNASYIGKGKIDEVLDAIQEYEATSVIVGVGLSPLQLRNLEETLKCPVIDKNMLILEIFSRRAQTAEAQAQVEIARLEYLFPRMAGSYEKFGRQAGGRNKGLGETKLELDKRHVERRIYLLKEELKKYEKVRKTQRQKRDANSFPRVALVGYTNAGKSSLMNYYLKDDVERQVFVKDMLFASLETYARKIEIDENHQFILHDTVGFVSDLPHNLVPAFHSTLEEIEDADFLLHIIDSSNPYYEKQMEVVEKTLGDLTVHDIPIINIYNKIDLGNERPETNGRESFFISTKTEEGLDALTDYLKVALWPDRKQVKVLIPYSEMKLVDFLLTNAMILNQEHQETGVMLEMNLDAKLMSRIEKYLI